MRAPISMLGLALAATIALPVSAQTVERLYVMDCGHNAANDKSRWTPGVDVGKPLELSDNCYLIKRGNEWLLWDTGYPDAIADKPLVTQMGTATRPKKLADQLAEIGVKPDDIKYVAVSHTHGDHIGNVDLFPKSTLLIQKAEIDFAFTEGKTPPFKKDRPTQALAGDFDVFGDGSVVVVSTPGHTPGHQCLMVRLPKTGYVILSGDLAHFKDNWDSRRVPGMNASADQTQASFKKIEGLMAEKKAQFWINHDKPSSVSQKRSPQFYD